MPQSECHGLFIAIEIDSRVILRTTFSHHRVTNWSILFFRTFCHCIISILDTYIIVQKYSGFIQNYGDYTYEEFKFSHGYWSYIKDTVQSTNFHLLWLYSRSSFFYIKGFRTFRWTAKQMYIIHYLAFVFHVRSRAKHVMF